MPLNRYRKVLRGAAEPRFFAARSSFQNQLEKMASAKECPFCEHSHRPYETKPKISQITDPTFGSAIALSFVRRSAMTPEQAAARIYEAFGGGKKTAIIYGDAAHGLRFAVEMLMKLEVPVAVVLATDAACSTKAFGMLKRISDAHAPLLRWANTACAKHFGMEDYVGISQKNIAGLSPDETIVRIPLYPGHIECDAKPSMLWLSQNSPKVRVQLMLARTPSATVHAPELSRAITIEELNDAVAFANRLRLDVEVAR